MPLTDGVNPVARNDGYVSKRGSAHVAMQQVDPDGSPLGTPDSVHYLGWIKKYLFTRKKTFEEELDQGGTNRSSDFTVEATLDLKIMQRDKPHILLTKLMDGDYARVYMELSAVKLGPDADIGQILVICAVTPAESGITIDGEDMHPDTKWKAVPNTVGAPITVALSAFTGGLGAGVGNATIAPGEYEDLVEFTYA